MICPSQSAPPGPARGRAGVKRREGVKISVLQVALQNFLSCAGEKSEQTPRLAGISAPPKQGRKNLAKFLGIDIAALAEGEPVLDCESVSLSSSTTSGGRVGGARQLLGRAGRVLHPRAASVDSTASRLPEIPEQLRTPRVHQVGPVLSTQSEQQATVLSCCFKLTPN